MTPESIDDLLQPIREEFRHIAWAKFHRAVIGRGPFNRDGQGSIFDDEQTPGFLALAALHPEPPPNPVLDAWLRADA